MLFFSEVWRPGYASPYGIQMYVTSSPYHFKGIMSRRIILAGSLIRVGGKCIGCNTFVGKFSREDAVGCWVPCGGVLEYLRLSPVSRRRRQKGNRIPGGIVMPLCRRGDENTDTWVFRRGGWTQGLRPFCRKMLLRNPNK
jgi:hypothetical protein